MQIENFNLIEQYEFKATYHICKNNFFEYEQTEIV